MCQVGKSLNYQCVVFLEELDICLTWAPSKVLYNPHGPVITMSLAAII
jgi:hypothetical protein